MALCLGLAGCIFGNSPEKLNKQIDDGKPAKALTTIEEQLASTPEDPALNLLAIKARLALCAERNCVKESGTTIPPLLTGFGKLAANVAGDVTLGKKTPPITLSDVFAQATIRFQNLQPQPEAVVALYASAPQRLQPQLATGLFQPALALARKGETAAAAEVLTKLGKTDNLPTTYTYAANALSAMLSGLPQQEETNLIALRSITEPQLPAGAAALLPWGLLKLATVSGTTPPDVLATLPARVAALKLSNLITASATAAMGDELLATAANPNATAQWQRGWAGTPSSLKLAIQRTALALNPNRPDVWATYLPALVSATVLESTTTLQPAAATVTLPSSAITSDTAPRIATQVIAAANRLANYPSVATPLATFASQIPLTNQQQIDLEKLSQSLLIKAAERGDVTSTVILARTLPGVAQNNRQSVVPLLVRFIRGNLRDGNFEAATNTAELLTQTLQMDVEFAPLVLEEFADDIKRRKINEALKADSPEMLLKSADDATLDLGPLFAFMQAYFADQPKVITAQLTTLIADADGTYGQPSAMYRLGAYFPEATLPPAKQQEWLAASLEQALLTDSTLSAVQLAETSAKLAQVHPGLNLAPLLESAVRRATTLEDQRTLWQSATPQVKEVLRAIRPEFVLLMQGIDAMAESRLNTAAQAFSGITDGAWLTEATPFIEQFNDRLLTLSGIYVPVSAAPSLKTGAIIVAPLGLSGGKLNTVSVTFISRVGTLSEAEPAALRTNAAATHRFSVPVVYNFDTRQLPISPQIVAQTPQGGTFGTTYGNIRSLKLQTEDGAETPILTVTLADGTNTPFIRTLVDTAEPLRPDGTYLLQTRVGTTDSTTQGILPPGSLLTLATENSVRLKDADSDAKADYVFPLSGTVRHPASAQPITFTGYYDPQLFTSTFTFSYPLPQSAQPARAAVRCQALAGPITCGAHNLNSARQAYAALISGLQTRESLATSSASRSSINAVSNARMLASAIPVIPSPTLMVTATAGLTVSSPTLALTQTPAISATTSLTTPLITPVTPTAPAIPAHAATTASPTLLEAPALEEDLEDEDAAEAPPAPTKPRISSEPEPGAFVNNSGSKTTSSTTLRAEDVAEPGVFINRSGGKSPIANAATSSTRP